MIQNVAMLYNIVTRSQLISLLLWNQQNSHSWSNYYNLATLVAQLLGSGRYMSVSLDTVFSRVNLSK